MPGNYRAPGVYVEELPSGVRPVVGVSTSTAAFVDVFARGDANRAIRIAGPGDFEREFGGTFRFSEASYAISQFFLNGGSTAFVVRVLPDGAQAASVDLLLEGTGGPSGSTSGGGASGGGASGGASGGTSGASGGGASGGAPGLTVHARNEGEWANGLMVGVQHPAASNPPAFDLVVGRKVTVGGRERVAVLEVFRGLTVDQDHSRYVRTVIERGSSLIRIDEGIGGRPGPTVGAGGDVARSRDARDFRELINGRDGDVPSSVEDAALATRLVGNPALGTGIWALDSIAPEIFNILCVPAMAVLTDAGRTTVLAAAQDFCQDRRAMLLIDPPRTHDDANTTSALSGLMNDYAENLDPHPNTAAYFPRLTIPDPLGGERRVGPSGTVAGIWARFDGRHGVWRAPAGTEATLLGANTVLTMNESVSEQFNPVGVNVLRTFPVFNDVVWGARTRVGADLLADQWKYVPVRRTALFIEESLRQGLQWVVFQPNDHALWAQIRLNVGSFMQRLFRLGAFAGISAREAYLVKCDADTTTADDVSVGVVNIVVGFQPLIPAEFVVIKIQQLTRPPEA